MRKIHLSLLLSLVAFFATGCPKYKPSVDFNDQNTFVNKVNTYLGNRQRDYINALARNDAATAKTIRNEVIELTLPYIDDAYMEYITSLQAGRDRTNFIADLIDLGTSAAVGITNGERSLQILGVALTAFRGGRRSADLNFFKEQTTPILISKMDGNRARVRANILSREREEVSTYPIGAAIGDIVEYYNAGTLVRAFTELSKDTAVATRESENELQEIKRRAGVVGAATLDQIAISTKNTSTLQGLAERYEKATNDIAAADADLANPAITDKTAANTKKEQATKEQKAALDNMQKLYQLIEADAVLKPLLDKIVEKYGKDSPQLKARIEASLKRLKDKDPANPPTGADYSLILQLLGGVVVDNIPQDPTLKGRWESLLASIQ